MANHKKVPMSRIENMLREYNEGQSLSMIGVTFGYSPEWVRRLLMRCDGFQARHNRGGRPRKLQFVPAPVSE